MRAVIQGGQVKTERDVHEQLAQQLDFGLYYGWKRAALWDRLSADVPRPVHIVWSDSVVSRQALGDEAFEALVAVMTAAARQDEDFGLLDRLTLSIE